MSVAAAPDLAAVDALLVSAATEARRWGRADLASGLDRERADLNDSTYLLAVIGEFGQGKSTLINTLFGTRVCGVDDLQSTTVPTIVRYGEHAAARWVSNVDRLGDRKAGSIVVDDVARMSTRPVPDGAGELQIEVELPNDLLRCGLVVVDTPGVGGGLAGARSAAILRGLSHADAVLFVTDASQELTEPEVDFLRQAAKTCPDVICAVTKIDFYVEWRRIAAIDTKHLHAADIPVEPIAVSAPLWQQADRTGNGELGTASGYPHLRQALRSRAIDRAGRGRGRQAVHAVRSTLGQLLSHAAAELESLKEVADPQTLARWQRAKRDAEKLRAATSRWQQLLGDRGADLVAAAELDLTVRMRAIRNESLARIEATDPESSWGDLEPWLYAKTNEELLAHHALVRDQADALVAEVGDLFGQQAAGLAEQLDLAVSSPAVTVGGLGQAATGRISWSELAIHAARGTTLGVAFVQAAVLLPGFTLVAALPATALLAIVFARRMVRSAREAQLKIRRAEAQRAVAAYLDESDMLARQDSRDTVRRMQHRVRDYFVATAQQMQESAASTLQAVERGMASESESRERRRQQLHTDLQRLRPLVTQADRIARDITEASTPAVSR